MDLATILKKDFHGARGWQWIIIVITIVVVTAGFVVSIQEKNKVYTVNDIIQNGSFQINVTKVEKKDSLEGFLISTKPKGVFVVINLQATNVSKESQFIGPAMFALEDQDGNIYDNYSVSFDESKINPKFSTNGTIIFDIPITSNQEYLRIFKDYLGSGDGILVNLKQP